MKNDRIQVLLADNQVLTSAGLLYLLADRNDMSCIGQASDVHDLSRMLDDTQPSLLIADYNLTGYITIEDLKSIIRSFPRLNVLILSSDSNKATILEVLQLGVKGYLTKDCGKEEVMMAIQSTARGEKFFCHKILDVILEKSFAPEQEPGESISLTTRETEILKLIASGYSTQKIADELFLSPHTVHTHRKSIIKKLNIKSPTEFVIHAMDFGLIKVK